MCNIGHFSGKKECNHAMMFTDEDSKPDFVCHSTSSSCFFWMVNKQRWHGSDTQDWFQFDTR